MDAGRVFGTIGRLGQGRNARLPMLRVAQLWRGRLVRENTYPHPRDVTVGDGADAEFVVPGLPGCRALLAPGPGGAWALALSQGMAGSLTLGGRAVDAAQFVRTGDAATRVPLGEDDRGLVEVGDISLFFQLVRPDCVIGRRRWAPDAGLVAATAVGAFVVVGLLVAAQFLWDPTADAAQRAPERRLLAVDLRIAQEREIPKILEVTDESDGGKQADGEEGKFGRPDAPPELESRVPRRDGPLASRIDPAKIGLLNVLRSTNLHTRALTDIVSDTAEAFDNRMAVAMAGTGSELQIGFGSGGMGFKGTGPGGGGLDGYGRIRAIGHLDGPGGPGHGVRPGLGTKPPARVAQIVGDGGSASQFCNRDAIRRIVMLRSAAFRACYEQRLQVQASLEGKVSVRWTIGTDGRVDGASVVESTLSSASVEQCVVRAIGAMRFEPPVGGVCVVAWPFVFRAE